MSAQPPTDWTKETSANRFAALHRLHLFQEKMPYLYNDRFPRLTQLCHDLNAEVGNEIKRIQESFDPVNTQKLEIANELYRHLTGAAPPAAASVPSAY